MFAIDLLLTICLTASSRPGHWVTPVPHAWSLEPIDRQTTPRGWCWYPNPTRITHLQTTKSADVESLQVDGAPCRRHRTLVPLSARELNLRRSSEPLESSRSRAKIEERPLSEHRRSSSMTVPSTRSARSAEPMADHHFLNFESALRGGSFSWARAASSSSNSNDLSMSCLGGLHALSSGIAYTIAPLRCNAETNERPFLDPDTKLEGPAYTFQTTAFHLPEDATLRQMIKAAMKSCSISESSKRTSTSDEINREHVLVGDDENEENPPKFLAYDKNLDLFAELDCEFQTKTEADGDPVELTLKVRRPRQKSCQTDSFPIFQPSELQPSRNYWSRISELNNMFFGSIFTRVLCCFAERNSAWTVPCITFFHYKDYFHFQKNLPDECEIILQITKALCLEPCEDLYVAGLAAVPKHEKLPRMCGICFNALSRKSGGLSPCEKPHHACHRSCLKNWHSHRLFRTVNGDKTCPHCRKEEKPSIVNVIEITLKAMDEFKRDAPINHAIIKHMVSAVNADLQNYPEINLRQAYHALQILQELKYTLDICNTETHA